MGRFLVGLAALVALASVLTPADAGFINPGETARGDCSLDRNEPPNTHCNTAEATPLLPLTLRPHAHCIQARRTAWTRRSTVRRASWPTSMARS